MIEDDVTSEFIVQLLEILIMLSGEQSYFDIFVENQSHIIVGICLNLMQTTNSEAELIMNDSSEFVNLALDCCDKQTSKIVKTQACKLLEHMCDNVDGAATCVTTFCCNALNAALQSAAGLPVQHIAEQGLWGMENEPFLTRTSPIIIAETCIVALTVISYILPKKAHLLPIFNRALA